ncbi:hypothetical protein HK101_003644, partial [Irineochytrium annulatum]
MSTGSTTRNDWAIFAAGFSAMVCFKYGLLLASRRLTGTDTVAAVSLGCFGVYVLIQVVNNWSATLNDTPAYWYWVIDSSTVLYTTSLCCILYMSILRVSVILNLAAARRRLVERLGLAAVALIFVTRAIRTVAIFITSRNDSTTNAALTTLSTNLQIATLLPAFVFRALMDSVSFWRLQSLRENHVEPSARESFHVISLSLGFETLLGLLATGVAFQETLLAPKNVTSVPYFKLSFVDWLLIAWCHASLVEQRPLYRAIFGVGAMGTISERDNGVAR